MSNNNGIGETRQHPKFHIEGGDLYLLIDNVHYRVPSYIFTRESRSVFRKILSPCPSPGVRRPGSNPGSALLLESVNSQEIDTFFSVVFNPTYTDYSFMTPQNWITILNIAHKWKFDNLKEAAIRELQRADIDIISRVALYQNNGVDLRYILPFYVDLCQRDGVVLSWSESRYIGHDATFAIMQARDIILRSPAHVIVSKNEPPRSPLLSEIPRASIFGILKEVLDIGDIAIDDHPGLQGNPADANTKSVPVNPNAG